MNSIYMIGHLTSLQSTYSLLTVYLQSTYSLLTSHQKNNKSVTSMTNVVKKLQIFKITSHLHRTIQIKVTFITYETF